MSKTHNFKIAKKKDIKQIMYFIKKNWDENHILAKNYNFFCYEFLNDKRINFILAYNKKTKILEAIQGFIPYRNTKNKHICGSITCVNQKSKKPFLGIETMSAMLQITKPKTYCGIGTNFKTMIPLVKKFFKRNVGIMDHYYILNNDLKKYEIAKISKKNRSSFYRINNQYNLQKIQNFESLNKQFNLNKNLKYFPDKDNSFLKKRYFQHPIYNYICYGVFNNDDKLLSFLIAREISLKKRKILTIVDFRGNPKDLGLIELALKKILKENNYEYIDLLCSGLSTVTLLKSGFNKKGNPDINIIPSYFDPFIKKNIVIWYEKSNKNLILFKGDADADRPRICYD